MKIQKNDIYHGPALMQIVEHNSFKALNKADEKYGHYLVNKDVRLWVKYSSAEDGPWQFTLQTTDLDSIAADLKSKGSTHIVLVCGHSTICCLNAEELSQFVDLEADVQWLKVEAPAGKQMRLTGSLNNKNAKLVPHNNFPGSIFTA